MSCSVLVLGGGPDREREVSLESAAAIAHALRASGFEVIAETVDRLDAERLEAMPGDVVFPALHGAWGEGGPMQDLLESSGRAYVGCGPMAARTAMDKMASKIAAVRIGAPTQPAAIVNVDDPVCPLVLPVVVKPVADGSSVGLSVCRTPEDWARAHEQAASEPGRVFMVEPLIGGAGSRRELAIGVLDGEALPIVEIAPSEGVYDFAAKYERDDTRYIVDPRLPRDIGERARAWSVALAREIDATSICRVDFMLDEANEPWFLEVNTMPGFTSHSLYPMAAKAAGLPITALCGRLVESALNRMMDPGGW